ncbi:MAG: hypothetical protein ACI8RZ_002858 [Myxococcota bacterium]|jgi:hypothetical protein
MLTLLLACNGSVEIILDDANNFDFNSNIIADSIVVPAQQDSPVDWSGLTADILSQSVDPSTEVDELNIVRFADLTQAEVIDGINNDTLKQSDLTGFVAYSSSGGETDAMLSEFAISGQTVVVEDEIQEGIGTYLISASKEDGEYISFVFFEPVDGADPATIELTGESAILEFDLDLDAGTPLTPLVADQTVVTWSKLTTNGAGNAIVLSNIDRLMLARYTLDLSELEERFLELEDLADELYIVDVAGLGSYDLMELEVEGFAGFEGEGTWLLAMRCSSCVNPSPQFVGLFE